MTHFTEEEKLIISMFRSNGRLITVSKIRAAMTDVDNDEMLKLMQSTADKLIDITEKEYRNLSESLIT
ncbi:MAG: hypothetical protein IJF87_05450 [Erysipelotrichaceae bacterium]|nr:hypothetical protein [Erysipelotrichaceae bacterium]